MAKKRSTKQPATEQDQAQQDQVEKGYGGSQDYATGKVSSDPSQATAERLKEDRARQSESY